MQKGGMEEERTKQNSGYRPRVAGWFGEQVGE